MKRILIAPNDDGFGTSAWVVGLAQELARRGLVEVTVLLTARPWERFHYNKYQAFDNIWPVILPEGVNNIVVAKNRDGSVNVAQTVERCILGYPRSRKRYAEAVAAAVDLSQFDLVVDFGVPHLVRVAKAAGCRTWTVFDHAWSLSLARMAGDHRLRPEAAVCLNEMRLDEAQADQVTLFAEPVCPAVYHDYWAEMVNVLTKPITGGMGGPWRTLGFVGHPEAAVFRDRLVGTEGTKELKREAAKLARVAARALLGLDGEQPTVLISGGGTAVWDDLLQKLFDSYMEQPPRYHVVTYNPAEAARRGVTMAAREVNGRVVNIGRWGEGVTFLGAVEGETHHPLFAAFDLVLTRAGGGTVDNALAHQVPLLLVEELGMWQVEQIRQSCLQLGIAEGVSLAAFQADPRGCMETAAGQLKMLTVQKAALSGFHPHREIWLANQLLAACSGLSM